MKSVEIVILAVTKTYDKYCIAGMDMDGNWIRPLPVGKTNFWSTIFYDNNELIKVGDIWRLDAYEVEYDNTSPGHTEDLRLITNPTFSKRLNNDELIGFVNEHQENNISLHDTLNARSRSLCLVEVEKFRNFMDRSTFDGSLKPRLTFTSNGEKFRNTTTSTQGYPITDLKWLAYTTQGIMSPKTMNSSYICIGLARTEPSKGFTREYPMVISVITDPEVPLLPSYPR